MKKNPLNRSFVFAMMAVVALAGAPVFAQAADEADFAVLHVGDPAPEFSEPLVAGKGNLSLSGLRGKVVLLNFWATWCPPCREEMPLFARLRKQWAGQFEVVGAVVFSSETDTQAFLKSLTIPYPIIRGSFDLMGQYNKVNALPTSYLIDRKGRVIDAFVGARSEAVYRAAIEKALKS